MAKKQKQQSSPFTLKAQVRTDPLVKQEFEVAVAQLGLSHKARFIGKAPNQENTTTALWFWFSRMGPQKAEAFLADVFPQLERFMDAEGAPGDQDSSVKPSIPASGVISRPIPAPRPRKKQG